MDQELQTELALFSSTNAAAISALLRRSTDWLSASTILESIHLPDNESNRRLVRKCAEDLSSELISGQQGYKHIENASEDEVKHFASWMMSQGLKMTSRAELALSRKGL